MKKLVVLLAALAGIAVLFVGIITFDAGSFDFNRLLNPGLTARFGNYGGGRRVLAPPAAFDANITQWGIRWFPTHVNFGPDNDTLLVSLCHVQRPGYCRVGKYRISDKHWDVLPFEDKRTYLEPIFSPDGKWIVVSSGLCDEQRNCDARDFQLMKMPPDGSKMELVADTSASSVSFAHNGKKLIYWRLNVIKTPGEPKYARSVDVYQLDWETGKESPLTAIGFMGDQRGQPFLTPDGERFVFTAGIEHALFGTGAPLFGQTSNNTIDTYIGSVKDAPISKQNFKALWRLEDINYPVDVDRQGRLLYGGDIDTRRKAGNPAALAIRPPNPNYKLPTPLTWDELQEQKRQELEHPMTDEQYRRGEGTLKFFNKALQGEGYQRGQGSALFLRKPDVDATDEAAFDIGGSLSSLSPDSKRLAFIWGTSSSAEPDTGIAVIGNGQPMKESVFLDWPKLDLVPTPPAKP